MGICQFPKLHIEKFYTLLFLCIFCIILLYFSNTQILDLKTLSPLKNGNSWLDNNDISVIDIGDINKLNQRDPKLMNYLKIRHLTSPSKLPYNFVGKFSKGPGEDGGITKAIRNIFKNATSGFFVECGGYDGIYSNTLFLEREFQWTGLLVECNPVLFTELRKAHRKAFLADVCISVTENPESINITSMDNWPAASSVGTGVFPNHIPSNFTTFEVQSFPFYSVIAAVGVKVVDFITLDVQSIEWKVIKNFPFDLIIVKVWVIEIELLSKIDVENLKNLMIRNGYRQQEISPLDLMFIHNSVN